MRTDPYPASRGVEAPLRRPCSSTAIAEERLTRAVHELRTRYGPSEAADLVESLLRLADQAERGTFRHRAG